MEADSLKLIANAHDTRSLRASLGLRALYQRWLGRRRATEGAERRLRKAGEHAVENAWKHAGPWY